MTVPKEKVLFTVPGSVSRSKLGNAWLMPIGTIVFTEQGLYFQYSINFMKGNLIGKNFWRMQTGLVPYRDIRRLDDYPGSFLSASTFRIITEEINGQYDVSVFLPQANLIPLLREFLTHCMQEESVGPLARQAQEKVLQACHRTNPAFVIIGGVLAALGLLLSFIPSIDIIVILLFLVFATFFFAITERPKLKYIPMALILLLLLLRLGLI